MMNVIPVNSFARKLEEAEPEVNHLDKKANLPN